MTALSYSLFLLAIITLHLTFHLVSNGYITLKFGNKNTSHTKGYTVKSWFIKL